MTSMTNRHDTHRGRLDTVLRHHDFDRTCVLVYSQRCVMHSGTKLFQLQCDRQRLSCLSFRAEKKNGYVPVELSRSIKQRCVFPSKLSRHLAREDNWSGPMMTTPTTTSEESRGYDCKGSGSHEENGRILYRVDDIPLVDFAKHGTLSRLNSRLIALVRSRDVRNSC